MKFKAIEKLTFHKLSIGLSVFYLFCFYCFLNDFTIVIPRLILYIIIFTSTSVIAFSINDFFDRDHDSISNKINLFNNNNQGYLIFIFLLVTGLTIVSLILLKARILTVLLLYSVPPVRLKERKLMGVIADALYAHVIPVFFVISMFDFKYSDHLFVVFLLLVWLLLFGSRNIINHQIEDVVNDERSQTNTFVIGFGVQKSRLLNRIIFISEALLFFVLLLLLPFSIYIVSVYIIYLIILVLVSEKNLPVDEFIQERALNEFYEIHFPLFVLIYFVYKDSLYSFLLFFHLIVFSAVYYNYLKLFVKKYIK